MPIPKYDLPKLPKTPKDKANIIVNNLCYDYNCCIEDAREALALIEKNDIDKSQFDFPYGSFEDFKKHTLAGEFDIERDISKLVMSDEEHKQIQKDFNEGRIWTTGIPLKNQPFFQKNRRNPEDPI